MNAASSEGRKIMLLGVKCAQASGRDTIKANVRIVVSFAISALFLLAILWSVDIRQTKEALRAANYAYIPLAVLLCLVTNVLRSYRWKYVLNPIRRISIRTLFSGVAIGYMANNLLPARLGELVRSYVIGKKEGISKSSILATIVVERLIDGFTLLLFLVLVSVFFTIPFWIKQVGFVAAICLSAFSVFLVLLLAKRKFGFRLIQQSVGRVSSRLAERVNSLLESFLQGLAIVNHTKDTLLAFVFTILAWIVEAGTYYVIGLAFDLNLPLDVAVVTLAIINFGILIPAGPGYVGTFEFFCVSALSLVSLDKSVALSYALVLHAVLVIPITVIGLMYFVKDQVSLAEIRG
jgi:uncharacterized protein (TIRG00374 family)